MRKQITVFACAAVLGGCASQTAQIGSYHNNGDQAPLVYSGQLLTGEFKNLSDGEAVAFAMGNDKAIARPNLTEIHVYKHLQGTSSSASEFDVKHCDPDGDGIPGTQFRRTRLWSAAAAPPLWLTALRCRRALR